MRWEDGGMDRGRLSQEDRSRSPGASAAALTRLGRRFARFRSERSRGTRYPDELRRAALALLAEVEPDALYRTCGVSFRQVLAWREASAARAASAPPQARVFTVVDRESDARGATSAELPTVHAVGTGVEVRLGPWTVIVRLEGGQSGAGGRACCP